MGREKKKAKRKSPQKTTTWKELSPEMISGLRSIASAVVLVALLIAAVIGLEKIKTKVYTGPAGPDHVIVALADPPKWIDDEGWTDRILGDINLPQDTDPRDYRVLARVAEKMEKTGWVSHVREVRLDMDGTIRVACDYRRPIAMMLIGDKFVAVARDDVNGQYYTLPETYRQKDVTESSGWLRIFGINTDTIPSSNEPLNGRMRDAVAAAELADLIMQQEFAPRISSIDVGNYGGRVDRHRCHIYLTTRGGGRIEWGSAIGEEIEEENAMQKLQNIAVWLKRGNSQARVDVAVYQDAFIEYHTEQDGLDIRTVDGAAPRR